MTAARTSFDTHHEQAERALQVVRVQQRRLRWQRRLGWGLFAALIAVPLYSVIPPPYGPGQPGVMFVAAAILFALLILGGERRSPWLATGGTGRRTIRALAPAVVVHAGAEEVAVEVATPWPAQSSTSTARGSTSDSTRPEPEPEPSGSQRWGWLLLPGQSAPEVGARVWVDADLDREQHTPLVQLAADGDRPQVLWPLTKPLPQPTPKPLSVEQEGSAPDQVLAGARRRARATIFYWALGLAGMTAFTLGGLTLAATATPSFYGSAAAFLMLTAQLASRGVPRLVTAWRLLKAPGLRAAVLVDRSDRGPLDPRAAVTLLVRDPSSGAHQLWGWTLLHEFPGRRTSAQVWLADTARPGQRAAIYLPKSQTGEPRLAFPATPIREVADSDLQPVRARQSHQR
ncbi:hypothetical protein BJY21_004127 [Kineosphaera limosa]|uniref:Uncharacterized protein n=1 Tax=Kineosphaera limosa NBRC 100340 TaxID=1184609 RepID=K6X6F4_9MICO|nr:hypothetical protein [Kineosphaera limosa]NYE02943.1 hypothetical protein [Kineosphaera limosa]GAB94374.1 hypothetical protein KILIM_004_01660 [Kineosphaera limosa NBRC 100340]